MNVTVISIISVALETIPKNLGTGYLSKNWDHPDKNTAEIGVNS